MGTCRLDITKLIWKKLSYQYAREADPKTIKIKAGDFTSQKKWENEYY